MTSAPGAPASCRPVGSRKLELAGEMPALPGTGLRPVREKIFLQTSGNRLSKDGDLAPLRWVVPAGPAGFAHDGLRHLHGPSDGAGAKYIFVVVCAPGADGGVFQLKFLTNFPKQFVVVGPPSARL